MKTKIIASAVVAAAALMVSSPLASANSELQIISGGVTNTVAGVGGVASYNGVVGNWDINVTTGIAGANSIDVNSVDKTTSGTSNPLEILWSADGFTKLGGYDAQVGGTLSAGLTDSFSSYYDSTLLGTTHSLTAPLTFSTSPFAGTDSGSVSGSVPFVLTEEVYITGGTAAGSLTSFDYNLSAVPDGGSAVILLGGAMTAMVLIRSKVGKQK